MINQSPRIEVMSTFQAKNNITIEDRNGNQINIVKGEIYKLFKDSFSRDILVGNQIYTTEETSKIYEAFGYGIKYLDHIGTEMSEGESFVISLNGEKIWN